MNHHLKSSSLNISGVITGCLESFCLACECIFTNGEEIEEHIKTSAHVVNLSLFPYLDKFEGHCIRKFNTGYYCQFCNEILLTAVKVNLHIDEQDHKQKRGTHLLKTLEGNVIAFNNILIKECVWHGLSVNACSICDIEYDNEDDHKKDTKHILNLIQKPVKFGANNAIFRQIDHSTMHCMTCNLVLSTNTLTHFNDIDHLKFYADCKIVIKTNGNVVGKESEQIENIPTAKIKEDNKLDKKYDEDDLSKILASTAMLQSMNISINLETETAFCRKCSLDVQFNYNAINTHIHGLSHLRENPSTLRYPSNIDKAKFNPLSSMETDDANRSDIKKEQNKVLPQIQNFINDEKCDAIKNVNENKSNSTKNEESLLELAKKHKITYNDGNNNAFCRTCKVKLPVSIRCFKEHVQGLKHIKQTELLLKRQKFIDFVYSAKAIPYHPSREYLDVIINEDYCLDALSFYFIVAIPDNRNTYVLRCLLCETQIASNITLPFYKQQMESHTHNLTPHDKAMDTISVITSVEGEFIREIRPGSFHCGYCNIVVKGWVSMEDHLLSTDHHTNKAVQDEHLKAGRPLIEARMIFNLLNRFRM